MATVPEPVAALLDAALVGELTVIDADGRPVTYPLIPLWDGERIYLTSSSLFSRKLEHIRGNPKVSVSITDPVAVGGRPRSRDDPGRRPGHRGGPARRLGAAPPDLGEEGAVDRLLPQGARRAAALLRAGAHRGDAAPRPLLGRRRHRRGAGRGRGRTGGGVMRSTPELDARAGLDKLATLPLPDPDLGRRRPAIRSASPSRHGSTRPSRSPGSRRPPA